MNNQKCLETGEYKKDLGTGEEERCLETGETTDKKCLKIGKLKHFPPILAPKAQSER